MASHGSRCADRTLPACRSAPDRIAAARAWPGWRLSDDIRPRRATGRPRKHPVPSAAGVAAAKLPEARPGAFRPIAWRAGTKGPLKAEFAAFRVRVADEHGAGPEQIIDVLVAADVPDAAAPPAADDRVDGHVPEITGRQHPPRDPGQAPLLVADVQSRHDSPPPVQPRSLRGRRRAGQAEALTARATARTVQRPGTMVAGTRPKRDRRRLHRRPEN